MNRNFFFYDWCKSLSFSIFEFENEKEEIFDFFIEVSFFFLRKSNLRMYEVDTRI